MTAPLASLRGATGLRDPVPAPSTLKGKSKVQDAVARNAAKNVKMP